MKNKQKGREKRSCSLSAPFIYFFLESMLIVILVYMVTAGDIFSKFGLILTIMGLVYPALKLPTFIKRVVTCRNYAALNKNRGTSVNEKFVR